MLRNLLATIVLCCALAAGCSLPPEKPVTKEELFKTGIYTYYTLKDSPESVLAALNRDGEVVLEGKYRDRSVFIKLMAMPTGVQVHVFEK